jgi:4-hydroxy 2-oxovalerate aldolase
MHNKIKLLDCTLRDGGYYNNWDFEKKLVEDYLLAMDDLKIDFVEIGFRFYENDGFKGAFAYSTDDYLKTLSIPEGLTNKLGVMLNGSDISNPNTQTDILEQLFNHRSESPVSLVRIACHVNAFIDCLPASKWLKEKGYIVGFNIMQIADCSSNEIKNLAKACNKYPIDVLYFADSMGGMNPSDVTEITKAFREEWSGDIGIHTHDNKCQAISNSLEAVRNNVKWVDSTVTGMGRGPGNAQTEFAILALEEYRLNKGNPTKLFEVIQKYFKNLKDKYSWGTNPFYYMAGQYSIHPTFIQAMLNDNRYSEEDIVAIIEYLKINGGKKFSYSTLETARNFYSTKAKGTWVPRKIIEGKKVLIIGSGPGAKKYKKEIENFIKTTSPFVIALNTQSNINEELIDAHSACHPVRLLADSKEHLKYQNPLIIPKSMLPEKVKLEFKNKKVFDYGIEISNKGFDFYINHGRVPYSLVMAYTFAVATSGKASLIYMVGFDGYDDGDPRNNESEKIISDYKKSKKALNLISLTPTKYSLRQQSIFFKYH